MPPDTLGAQLAQTAVAKRVTRRSALGADDLDPLDPSDKRLRRGLGLPKDPVVVRVRRTRHRAESAGAHIDGRRPRRFAALDPARVRGGTVDQHPTGSRNNSLTQRLPTRSVSVDVSPRDSRVHLSDRFRLSSSRRLSCQRVTVRAMRFCGNATRPVLGTNSEVVRTNLRS
jgi:hypothetical protein